MSQHTFVFAKITPKPEHFDVANSALQNIIKQTREESGCFLFTLHDDNSGSLYLYEEWLNEEALQKHYEMDYTKAVFEAYKGWLATTPEITKMMKVA